MNENLESDDSFHDINLKNNTIIENVNSSENQNKNSIFINWQDDLTEEDLSYYTHK